VLSLRGRAGKVVRAEEALVMTHITMTHITMTGESYGFPCEPGYCAPLGRAVFTYTGPLDGIVGAFDEWATTPQMYHPGGDRPPYEKERRDLRWPTVEMTVGGNKYTYGSLGHWLSSGAQVLQFVQDMLNADLDKSRQVGYLCAKEEA
jgi:hypothetical protein